jgi:hypothetical protein
MTLPLPDLSGMIVAMTAAATSRIAAPRAIEKNWLLKIGENRYRAPPGVEPRRS